MDTLNSLKLIILCATCALVSIHGSLSETSLESDGSDLETSSGIGLQEQLRRVRPPTPFPWPKVIPSLPKNLQTSRMNITCNISYCLINELSEKGWVTCFYRKHNKYGIVDAEQACCVEPCVYSRHYGDWCWIEDSDSPKLKVSRKWAKCKEGVPYYKKSNNPEKRREFKPIPKSDVYSYVSSGRHVSKDLFLCKKDSRCTYSSWDGYVSCVTTDGVKRKCCYNKCAKQSGTSYSWCRVGKGKILPGPWDYCSEGAPHYY